MRGLKYLPAVFLMLVSLDGSALAQFFGQCRTGSQEELSLNIKAHAEHTYRMEAKFLHEYYLQGPLPSDLQAPTIDDVQKYLHNLGERRAAVLFYAYDQQNENLCTWLISKQEITSHRAKVNKAVIQNLQPRLLNGLGVTSRARSRIPTRKGGKGPGLSSQKAKVTSENLVGQATGVLLPPPIAGILPQKSIDTIIVVPIFQFGTIPFSVLNIGGKPLIETTSVLIAPGFDVFKDGQQATPADFSQSVIVGDPAYDDPQWNLKPLPGARAEAEEVGRIVGSSPLIGEDANIGTIKRLIETDRKNPGLIYLATHGRADTENPLDGSWIWLSPEDNRYGRWAPREIQNLPLKKGRPLVVLSACQTGLGKNFGVGTIGMARAWHRAGASSVAMSLWSVSDNATRSLMTRFVRLATEIPPDKALREAMLETRKEFPEPFNWAGFTVFGLPSHPPELLTLGPSKGAPPSTGTPPGIPVIDDPTRTPEPASPPTAGESEKPPPNLFWNTWAEDDEGQRLDPVPRLKTDTLYRLSLDLAAIRYRVAGVVAAETGQVIKKQVEKWLKTAMPPQTLSVLLLPDPGMFVNPPTPAAVDNFVVNVDRLRAIRDSGVASTDNASFQIQRDSSKVGETVFKVRTKGHQGPAAVAFSIWYRDRPIDEVSVRFCIADTPETEKAKCGDMKPPVAPQGLALIRVADDSAPSPKAAIHYVSFGEDLPVTGVFHDNSWEKDRFIVWQHNQTAKDFSKFISENFMKNIASGATDNNLLVRGEDLFLFLFPKDVTSIDGTKTKIHKHVRDFLLPYLQAKPPPVDNVPSLFVRMIRVAPSPSLPIPLGLIAMRLDEAKGIKTKDNGRFLGDYFRIESPLEVQTYASFDNCLSRWVMVLPPGNTDDDAINQALTQLGDTIENWRDMKEALPFDRMTPFADWINRTAVFDGEDLPTTLITLSHHNQNSLYFYKNDFEDDDPLQKSKINRKFAQPSVAILDGCGTGGEGALELIRELNYRGFSTIVAAPAEIKGYMAGSFLKVFADEIAASDPAKGETIGKVFWKSIQQLKKAKPEGVPLAVDYGAKAHLFSLLGNGEVPICAPRKENRPKDDL